MKYRIALAAALAAPIALLNTPAQATPQNDPDHRHCVSQSEWRGLTHTNYGVRRSVLEQRWEVKALPIDANYYIDPANPHLYPVAYKTCGYYPDEQMLVIMYRTSSDTYWWCFKLWTQFEELPPHAHPRG